MTGEDFTDEPDDSYDFLAIDMYIACQDALNLSAILPDEERALLCRLQANLQTFRDYISDQDQQISFIDELETINHAPNKDDLLEIAKEIDEVLKKLLGDKWVQSSNIEIAKAVKYVRNGKIVAIDIVSPNNFFFNPPSEQFANDKFPTPGRVLPEVPTTDRIIKKITVFNPNGLRVYWGDLTDSEIKNLQGTYYVLDENSTFHMVPDFAVVTHIPENPTWKQLPFSEQFDQLFSNHQILAIDYVKTRAVSAIVNGRLMPNNRQMAP